MISTPSANPAFITSDFTPPKQRNASFLSRYQVALPFAIEALSSGIETTALSTSFQPSDYDVVCGRGKGSYNQPGNKRFREVVHEHIPTYLAAKSKVDKSVVLNTIIECVQQQDNGTARFVKHSKKEGWFVIGDDAAREKVGHAIREAIAAATKEPSERQNSPKVTVFITKQSDLLAQQQQLFARFMEFNDNCTLVSL